MDQNDFWTTIVAAITVFVLSFPSLLPVPEGQTDNYGHMRWLLVLGPAAMVALAVAARRRSQRVVVRQERSDDNDT